MKYRRLGKTGLNVSALGFGCMRMPIVGGIQLATDVFDGSKPIDEEAATQLIHTAIERGVNLFDTAYGYHGGQSEPFLGKAVEKMREKIYLSTKLPPWPVEKPADMERILGEQLERLRTDHIDIYMLHGMNRGLWDKMKGMGVLTFLDRVKSEGKVRHVGFSFHDDAGAFREIVDAYDWEMCLIQLNYFDAEFQAGEAGMKYAAAKGIGVVAMEPLRGGRLTTKIPEEVREIWERAAVKRTPTEWALRWVWNHGEVGSALSGMNGADQLEENLRVAEKAEADSLTAEDFKTIGEAREIYRKMMKVGCTSCAYCMPCPNGVDIPMNFSLFNDTFMFHDPETAHMLYNTFMSPEVKASNCSECGTCEEKCPQQIKVSEVMKMVDERLKR